MVTTGRLAAVSVPLVPPGPFFRKRSQQLDRLLEVTNGLGFGGPCQRALAGPLVGRDGLLGEAPFLVVPGDYPRLGLDPAGEVLLECPCNDGVILPPPLLEKRLVRRLLDQGVLEDVGGERLPQMSVYEKRAGSGPERATGRPRAARLGKGIDYVSRKWPRLRER